MDCSYVCICIYLLYVSTNKVTQEMDNKSVLERLISILNSYVNNIYDVRKKKTKETSFMINDIEYNICSVEIDLIIWNIDY